jgi:hypothetical protein
MPHDDAAIARLERARSGIRQALSQWDAADLDQVENSRALLVAALADLRFFETAVRAGEVPVTEELCTTILTVKQEVAQTTRVVDACVAFYRGLEARTGGAPPVYDAEGRITGESTEMEPEVHA